jgi:hypothetical protein
MPGEYGFRAGSTAPNNNAYGDQSQVGGSMSEFHSGQQGQPGRIASVANNDPGDLRLNSQQFNAQVPRAVTPVRPGVRLTSVLQPLAASPNGMSAADAARRTFDGQYLGSVNGTSESSFEPSALRRLAAGQDAI